MAKVFTVDVAKCNGCYNCQLACKDEHAGNEWLPYAAAQPETGQFWVKVEEHVEGTIPKVRIHYIARLCGHCEEAVCMKACEKGAIYKREDGLVIIDPEKCEGCGSCAEVCPYGVIYRNREKGISQKCTGCAHLLDNGYEKPRCVEACPTDALSFGEYEELEEFIEGAERQHTEGEKTKAQVYYRNIPGKFIGGTVYDPEEKEVIIGARCRATIGGKTYHTETDSYGDFWFNDLPVGVFKVVITAEGYEAKAYERIRTKESVNLGDIAMNKI